MPLYVSGTGIVDRWAQIAIFKGFLEDNGWQTDLYTAGSRFHFSRPGKNQHYDMVSGVQTGEIAIAACTGFNSGAAYSAQPGHYGVTSCRFGTGAAGDFWGYYSCGDDIYVRSTYTSNPHGCVFFDITQKIGNWAGGVGVAAGGTSGQIAFLGASGNGWVLIDGVGRGIYGTHGNTPLALIPSEWNRASLLVPVLMCANDWVETATNKIPIGYLSDYYTCSPGSDFQNLEIVTINGKDHIWAYIGMAWGLLKLGY